MAARTEDEYAVAVDVVTVGDGALDDALRPVLHAAEPRRDRAGAARMLAHAWLVTALNPKSITFFVAFLPQFLNRGAALLPQVLVFETTFVLLAFANALGYGFAASRARRAVSSPRIVSAFNRAGGTLLVGAGIATVALHANR